MLQKRGIREEIKETLFYLLLLFITVVIIGIVEIRVSTREILRIFIQVFESKDRFHSSLQSLLQENTYNMSHPSSAAAGQKGTIPSTQPTPMEPTPAESSSHESLLAIAPSYNYRALRQIQSFPLPVPGSYNAPHFLERTC